MNKVWVEPKIVDCNLKDIEELITCSYRVDSEKKTNKITVFKATIKLAGKFRRKKIKS